MPIEITPGKSNPVGHHSTVASTLSKLTTYSAAKRSRSMNIGESGFDELVAGEHLTSGSNVASATWDQSGSMHNNTGAPTVTLKTPGADLAALFVGELLNSLQVLNPSRNRTFERYTTNWANGNCTQFSTAGNWLWTYAASAGMYWQLAATYAPMTYGQTYKMTLYNLGQIWSGTWEFQDYDGNELTLASYGGADSPMGTVGQPFRVTTLPQSPNDEYWFTPSSETTTGGFKVVAYGGLANGQYWDNFELVNAAAEAIAVGSVFKVTSSIDTNDAALAAAKSAAGESVTAVAGGDLFAVTNITGGSEAVVYIGNDVGGYAFTAVSTTSTLTQTATNRTTAGANAKGKASKEYAFTYTIAVQEAIAPAGALTVTVETFGESTELTLTAGTHTTYFNATADAATADFDIQSVSSAAMTAGVLAISDMSLVRCCDSAANPNAGEWIGLRALEDDATVSATAVAGDDLASLTLVEGHPTLRGRWSRVRCTDGKVAAYRL